MVGKVTATYKSPIDESYSALILVKGFGRHLIKVSRNYLVGEEINLEPAGKSFEEAKNDAQL